MAEVVRSEDLGFYFEAFEYPWHRRLKQDTICQKEAQITNDVAETCKAEALLAVEGEGDLLVRRSIRIISAIPYEVPRENTERAAE